MNIRTSIVALSATFLVTLGGCQMASTVGASESSSTPKGGIAFRLSSQNVSLLQSESLDLRYKVSGPGMDTLSGSALLDTAPMFIPNVPVGLRFVELTAVDRWGNGAWYGRDSLVVGAGQYAFAHVVLRRLGQGPTGTVVLDVSLDSMTVGVDSTRPALDTVWSTQTYHSFYPQSYTTCDAPVWAGIRDSLAIHCTRVIGLPIASDTTWADTTVQYPVSDTARWCMLTDSTASAGGMNHASFRCLRLHYQPYTGPVDTIWHDTTNAPNFCNTLSVGEVLCYRPLSDSSRSAVKRRQSRL